MNTYIPRWLRVNFRIKFGLFILALLLWFLVVIQRSYEHTIIVPISVSGIKSDKVLVKEIPAQAKVVFRASGRELLQLLYTSTPHLKLDLSTISNFYTFRLNPEMIIIPRARTAEIINIIEPDSIEVVLDTKLKLRIPVLPRVNAKPAPGHTLYGEYEVFPAEVNVTGPRGRIVRLSNIETELVDLEKVKHTTELKLNLEKPDIYGISLSTEWVKVIIHAEKLGERRMQQVSIKVVNIPSGREVVVDPLTAEIELKGGITQLSDLSVDSISAFVDFKGFDILRGGKTRIQVETPPGIELLKTTPPEVRLIVRRK
ncbi:hypothetical protein K9N50_06660 [bacterium]|nr:hypothetical protein [bacterium]